MKVFQNSRASPTFILFNIPSPTFPPPNQKASRLRGISASAYHVVSYFRTQGFLPQIVRNGVQRPFSGFDFSIGPVGPRKGGSMRRDNVTGM